jgi:integrase/recombinase XerD
MKLEADFAPLCESFFTKRLIGQRKASPYTIAAYAHTFRLLVRFAQDRLGQLPSKLALAQLDSPFLAAFLYDLETARDNGARSRNARLAALRSFDRYSALEAPQHAALIQRVLSIPYKRILRRIVDYLTRSEVEALLAVADKSSWVGRRNYAFILTAVQTGLRLSELTGLRRRDVFLGLGAHIRCFGKGRKERCTPLAKPVLKVLVSWIEEIEDVDSAYLFPNLRGGRLSADAAQHLVANHATAASQMCPSLTKKRVTPHVLRHTAAMELLQAGIDRSLIAIWLGHESLDSTQIYLDANLALKEEILAKTDPLPGKPSRYRPDDRLLAFLKAL